jgi:hypothetical protein
MMGAIPVATTTITPTAPRDHDERPDTRAPSRGGAGRDGADRRLDRRLANAAGVIGSRRLPVVVVLVP